MTPAEEELVLDGDYRDGYQAFIAGEPRCRCPFVKRNRPPLAIMRKPVLRSKRVLAWMAGWTDARHGVKE